MVEVHEAFRLLPETLLLAVNMLDRLLSLRRVSETRLQLLGVTALFIAAKFEEIATPSISHFAGATAEAFTTEDIVVAESYMLTVLEYRLGWPSPLSFLRRISKADGYRTKIRNLCKYMVEEALLMGKGWVGVMPSSKVAAAAFWMARKMDNSQPWHANMKFYSGYEEKELETAVRLLFLHFKQNEVNAQSDKHTAVYRKWSNSAHMRISHVVAEWFADFDDFNELWQV
jgi:G2/mitotic-specific cyclin 1/2